MCLDFGSSPFDVDIYGSNTKINNDYTNQRACFRRFITILCRHTANCIRIRVNLIFTTNGKSIAVMILLCRSSVSICPCVTLRYDELQRRLLYIDGDGPPSVPAHRSALERMATNAMSPRGITVYGLFRSLPVSKLLPKMATFSVHTAVGNANAMTSVQGQPGRAVFSRPAGR